MTICYFTATGNCLYVARRLGGTLLSIPQLMKQKHIEITDEAVGIVCPCYAGEMPMMVREFLEKAIIETDYCFFIYTYGMSVGEASAHAKIALETAGIKLNYVNKVQMVDNYLPGFEMQEQINTLPTKNVENQITKIQEEIRLHKERIVTVTPAVKAKMAMYKKLLADRILKKNTAQYYIVNDKCLHCGVCAKVCPANNIIVTDKKVIFSSQCEVCYACLHNCPHNAIHMKQEKSSIRFRNDQVSLKDIINANE